jgi:hypothetical protein
MLVESLIASAVLTLVVLAVLSSIVAGQANASQALHTQRAVRLAEEMIERILAVPYGNIASFNGYQESPGGIKDIAGSLYPSDYQVFRRQVATQSLSQSVGGLGSPITGTTVTVTVEDAKGLRWVVTRFVPQPVS